MSLLQPHRHASRRPRVPPARVFVEAHPAVRGCPGHATGPGLDRAGTDQAGDELDRAAEFCARAHRLALDIDDRLLRCYTAQAPAKVWIRQGDTGRAREPLSHALAGCLELRDLGAVYARLGDCAPPSRRRSGYAS